MDHSKIDSFQELANYLRCNIDFLRLAVDNDFTVKDTKDLESKIQIIRNHSKDVHVSRHHIKKKGKKGGYRVVHEIMTYELENSLKILNNYLNEIYQPSEFIHGFVKGKNTKTNATPHLEKKLILSVDIKDYFESIPIKKIISSFEEIGFKKSVSEWIANIVTIDGYLVQGFCTSPTIANIVTQDLDFKLVEICGKEITYSRYADDLYFSSNNQEPNLKEITKIIEKYGFILNDKKTKFMRRGQPQYVTGLTIFDEKTPRIPKMIKRNIRLEIHYLNKFGYKRHARKRLIKSGENPKDPNFKNKVLHEIDELRNRLYGWLHFIYAIEPKFAIKYLDEIRKAKR